MFHEYDTRNERKNQGSLKGNALRLATMGFHIFPLQPRGKIPFEGTHGHLDATTDLETIADWWTQVPDANIGIALAASGLLAVDVDPRHGGTLKSLGQLPETICNVSGRGDGGQHLVFLAPSNGKVRKPAGVDTPNYIVAPPSVHPETGQPYHWADSRAPWDIWDIPELPGHLLEMPRKVLQSTGKLGTELALVKDALAAVDPWAGDYSWWVKMLAGIHSEHPGPDGLAVAEGWADGQPGEVEKKWHSFSPEGNRTGRATIRTVFAEAKKAGWVKPALPTGEPLEQMGSAELYSHLDSHLADITSGCPICGSFYPMTRIEKGMVKGKIGCMRCKKRNCKDWQKYKSIKQLMDTQPWDWTGHYVTELDQEEYEQYRDQGTLARKVEHWLTAPTLDETLVVFSEFPLVNSAAVSLRTMAEMAVERIASIPKKKRLRRSQGKPKPKQDDTQQDQEQPAAKWQKHAYGLVELKRDQIPGLLAAVEAAGGTVDWKRNRWQYPVELSRAVSEQLEQWRKQENLELVAYSPPTGTYATKSDRTLMVKALDGTISAAGMAQARKLAAKQVARLVIV